MLDILMREGRDLDGELPGKQALERMHPYADAMMPVPHGARRFIEVGCENRAASDKGEEADAGTPFRRHAGGRNPCS